MLLSSAIVTCLARSTACRTCCWCCDQEHGEGGRSALPAGAPHGPASRPAALGLCSPLFSLGAADSPRCPPALGLAQVRPLGARPPLTSCARSGRICAQMACSLLTISACKRRQLSAQPQGCQPLQPPSGVAEHPGDTGCPCANPPCRDFLSCCQGRAAARAAGPPPAARSSRTHGREPDSQTPVELGQAELRAQPLASSWLR